MRIYELRDEAREDAGTLAYLECYDEPRSCYLEISPDVDRWDLPFILFEHAARGELSVGADWSLRWVQSRLVPRERQNLGEVLRESGLESYDEFALIDQTEGRCSQDACYLVRTTPAGMPAWYDARLAGRVREACALGGFRLVVAMRDGRARVLDAQKEIGGRREFGRVLADEDAFAQVTVEAGGHGVRWGTALALSSDELAHMGRRLPLGSDDLADIARQLLCDAGEAASLLGCSRQNVSDLVRRGRLVPVETGGRTTLFRRSDVIAWRDRA